MEPRAGDRHGSYQLQRRLGRGGMGEVWYGTHVVTGSPAAVKLVSAGGVARGWRRYLERESRAIARLSHPNVIALFEVGEAHLALQYIRGHDLRRRLQTPLAPSAALHVARQVAAALDHAHGRGVIHRDVKPGNILLDHALNAHLGDFGLALAADEAERAAPAGTPEYMAPEQAARGVVGPAADQYALARTLVEMLCGRQPPLEAGAAIAALPPGLPPRLRVAIARALEPAPERRWPSVRALADELAGVQLDSLPPPRQLAPERRPVRTAWLAAGERRTVGHEIERVDVRISALRGRGVDAAAVDALLDETGYEDLGWSVYGSALRLGSLADPRALSRVAEVIVLLHGWGFTRDSWQRIAVELCHDNAEALVLALDLGGFGDSPFRRGQGAALAAGATPAGMYDLVQRWLHLLGFVDLPVVVVGHSMTGLAALVGPDDHGLRCYRVALTPPLPAADRSLRRAFLAGSYAVRALPMLKRLLMRNRVHRSALRGLNDEDRATFYRVLRATPVATLAALSAGIARTPMPSGAHLRRAMILRGTDDPMTSTATFLGAVELVAELPPGNVRVLATPSHVPHLEDARHPEWTRRNAWEIVDGINAMLAACRDRTLPESPAEALGAAPTVVDAEASRQRLGRTVTLASGD